MVFGEGGGGTVGVALVGAILAGVAHWASVVLLFWLGREVWGAGEDGKGRKVKGRGEMVAFLGAVLHVFSPAGVFLCAPYAEGVFSLLSFLGFWGFVRAGRWVTEGQGGKAVVGMVGAGGVLGLACLMRGNGVLGGGVFLWMVVKQSWKGFELWRVGGKKAQWVLGSVMLGGVSGMLMGAIAAYPQYLAFVEYCAGKASGQRRPWCDAWMPSIYAWVQKEYW